MSAALIVSPAAALLEHRSHQRFPLQLEAEYRLLNRGRVQRSGYGSTVNISSGGVLFATSEPLSSGSPIELVMSWPFLLEGVCPLKLVMRGRVVRIAGNEVAIESKNHEFRTAGARVAKAHPLKAGCGAWTSESTPGLAHGLDRG